MGGLILQIWEVKVEVQDLLKKRGFGKYYKVFNNILKDCFLEVSLFL